MCGIFGFVGTGAGGLRTEAIRSHLKHRGPDEDGTWIGDGVVFVHTRLSIVGLENGHQPIISEDGRKVLVCNGEVYNHADLRSRLENKGHHFRTESDNEVILHAYEAWGPRAVEKLDGMFAFAIYDMAKGDVIMARDPFGIKPLYYYASAEKIVFSSEITPILMALGDRRVRIDADAIAHFLSFRYFPPPLTPFREIRALKPGEWLIWRQGGDNAHQRIKAHTYFDPMYAILEMEVAARESEEIERALTKAVERRFMGEVPLGTFLSGGLDSSLISYYMHKLGGDDFRTYTIRFPESDEEDDSYYAMRLSRDMGWDIQVVDSTSEDLKFLDTIIAHTGLPIGDSALIPTYKLSSIAVRDVKFVITGEGADEVFGGYPYYTLISKQLKINRLIPGRLKPALARHLSPIIRPEVWAVIISNLSVLSDEERGRIMKKGGIGIAIETAKRALDVVAKRDVFTGLMAFDIALWLPSDLLLKLDASTMANGLEGRVPFVSTEVFYAAFGLAGREKISGRDVKIPLKRIAERYLPHYVTERKKHGFNVPMGVWLHENIRDVRNAIESEVMARVMGDTMDLTYFSDLLRRFEEWTGGGKGENYALSQRVWNAYALALWSRHVERYVVDVRDNGT